MTTTEREKYGTAVCFGGSGSGKSHYLYQNITKEAEENPSLSYLVLVPEQFTMQTQKDLVMHGSRKGIMNIDVLSFVRLAHRIFEETGKGGFPVLDALSRMEVHREAAVFGDISGQICAANSPFLKPFLSALSMTISTNARSTFWEKLIAIHGSSLKNLQ